MSCPHCAQTDKQTRAGNSLGRQRYHCRSCGRRYTETGESRGYPESVRIEAARLRAEGGAIRQIASELRVNHQTVANWLRRKPQWIGDPENRLIEATDPDTSPPVTASEKKRPTITDVAERAGVSVSSVSNFLNDKGHLSEATRQRIQKKIEELNFTPSALMRAIRHRQTRIFGVLMHGLSTMDESVGRSITPPLLAGVLRGAASSNYNVLLYPQLLYTLHDQSTVPFLDGHVDGLVWFAPPVGDSVLARVAQAGLPTIALLTNDVPDRIGYINTDGVDGVGQAVRHLAELGHRQIAYLGARRQSNFIDRHNGYRLALTAEKIKRNAKLEIALAERWQDADVARALDVLRSLPIPPTAVVTATDSIAKALFRAATAVGLRIPDDFSVVGFDDIPDAEHTGGGLTTIRQPFSQVGQLAAERLAALIAGAPIGSCRITLPNQLVIRSSTAPPPR